MEDLNRIIYLTLGNITYIFVNGVKVDSYDDEGDEGDRLDKALPHITDISKEVRVQEVDHEFDCTGLLTEDEFETINALTIEQEKAILEHKFHTFERLEIAKWLD
jgi:hypothetical protein